MDTNIWDLIHPERDALAADLTAISQDQWASRSLCDDWTVRDAVAHLIGGAKATPGSFFLGFVRNGFSFPRYSATTIEANRGATTQDTLAAFRQAAHRTTSPPGPKAAWIGEIVIHAEDIRRPLGIPHVYNAEAVRRAADMYVGSNALIGAKKRIEGVRLEATDTDWSSGQGPVASGSLLALLMAMTGRKTFLDELTGEGVEVLRGR